MMADKLTLLVVDKLTMGEVPVLEKMSGFSVIDIIDMDGGAVPMSVLMGLAYLTERRARPSLKKQMYTNLTAAEFMQRLEDKFEFETVDDEEDDESPDPTEAA
jgi:hypothetical protein